MPHSLYTKLIKDVQVQAKANRVSSLDAIRAFMDAYEDHKRQHGSFRHHPEYADAMNGRFRYMHDKAIKYIQEHKR